MLEDLQLALEWLSTLLGLFVVFFIWAAIIYLVVDFFFLKDDESKPTTGGETRS